MPTQPTAQIAVQWEFANASSDPTYNVFNVAKLGSSDPWDASELNTLIDMAGNAWSDTIGLVISEGLDCVNVTARQVVEGGGFTVTKTPSEGTWLNTDTSPPAEPWICAVVNHASTAPGRRGIGRTYLPGLRATFVDQSGTINGPFRAQLASAFGEWRDLMDAGEPSVAQVVYSRTYDEVATVISSSVRPLTGIQRDRRAGSR